MLYLEQGFPGRVSLGSRFLVGFLAFYAYIIFEDTLNIIAEVKVVRTLILVSRAQ